MRVVTPLNTEIKAHIRSAVLLLFSFFFSPDLHIEDTLRCSAESVFGKKAKVFYFLTNCFTKRKKSRNCAAEAWSISCHVSTPRQQKVIKTIHPRDNSTLPPLEQHFHTPAVRKKNCLGSLKFPTFRLSVCNVRGVCNPAVCGEVKGQEEGNLLSLSDCRLWQERERDLQIGRTWFLLYLGQPPVYLNEPVMNRPDQRESWLLKQVVSRRPGRWRGGKKCLFQSRLNLLDLQ